MPWYKIEVLDPISGSNVTYMHFDNVLSFKDINTIKGQYAPKSLLGIVVIRKVNRLPYEVWNKKLCDASEKFNIANKEVVIANKEIGILHNTNFNKRRTV